MTAATPKLLVSVRDANEAREALAGGADWIDLKEPRRGALGAVDAATARDVVACVSGRAPISAAAGELRDWTESPAAPLHGVPGITYQKLGLAGCVGRDWQPRWRAAQAQLAAANVQLVAAIYADADAAGAPQPADVLATAIDGNTPWILWDTYDKSTGPLVEHLSIDALSAMLDAARSAGRKTVVAGRLEASIIARLPLELVDMIAVRGAACRGSRDSAVCRRRVAALRELVARHGDCGAAPRRSSVVARVSDFPPRPRIS